MNYTCTTVRGTVLLSVGGADDHRFLVQDDQGRVVRLSLAEAKWLGRNLREAVYAEAVEKRGHR